MIIHVSVHDENYQNMLKEFCEDIALGIPPVASGPFPETEVELYGMRWNELHEKLKSTLAKPDELLTEEDRQWVLDTVRMCFRHFVVKPYRLPKHQAHLKAVFTCEITPYVTDCDRKGRDFYVFPHAKLNRVLCF